jgi:G3E family GTPase
MSSLQASARQQMQLSDICCAICCTTDAQHVLCAVDSPPLPLLLLLLPAVEQVAFADRILLNKTDLVGQEEKETIKARIKVSKLQY